MSNIKCSECGLVNWADQVECKRCQALLTVQEKVAAQLIGGPEEKPFFTRGLTLLTGLLVFAILSAIVSRVFGLEKSDVAKMIAIMLMFSGSLLMLLAHVWLLIRIFEQSIGWGLGALFVPLVGLVAIVKFWENTKRSFVSQLVCVGIMISAALVVSM
ncbi:MAG TPA: hypothetical protein VLL54_02985 [Pyrinomonadaceae bacterium]|nr:hypothetical protein [Pyrinomonadaceae bacterium]